MLVVFTCFTRISTDSEAISIRLIGDTEGMVVCKFSGIAPARQTDFQFIISTGCYFVNGVVAYKIDV